MAQALFQSWFVDFEPFRDGEFVESELGLIPKGWRVENLSEIMEINPKRILKKGTVAPYLSMANMPTDSARAGGQPVSRVEGIRPQTRPHRRDSLRQRDAPGAV